MKTTNDRSTEQHIEVILRLPVSVVRLLDRMVERRGYTFRATALADFIKAKGHEYLTSLPDRTEDEDEGL